MNYQKHSHHSDWLRQFFEISSIGVDFYNKFNVAFEFKETIKTKNFNFKVYSHQVIESKYIVFFIRDLYFFIVLSELIKSKVKLTYASRKENNYCYPISKRFLINNSIYMTNGILSLKTKIYSLKQ